MKQVDENNKYSMNLSVLAKNYDKLFNIVFSGHHDGSSENGSSRGEESGGGVLFVIWASEGNDLSHSVSGGSHIREAVLAGGDGGTGGVEVVNAEGSGVLADEGLDGAVFSWLNGGNWFFSWGLSFFLSNSNGDESGKGGEFHFKFIYYKTF